MNVRLYTGNYIYSVNRRNPRVVNVAGGIRTIFVDKTPVLSAPKAIAFDLDETLGFFSDMYLIWTRIDASSRTQPTFNALMDLYPEFLRTDILSILAFIQTKIARGECLPIYIYTNNQCGDPTWVELILTYLEWKLHASALFARPVRAFKIKDARVEPNRTTHEKTYSEFVKCTMLRSTELCYIDDVPYDKMKHRRVYFIQPPPYRHYLSAAQIADRFTNSRVKIPPILGRLNEKMREKSSFGNIGRFVDCDIRMGNGANSWVSTESPVDILKREEDVSAKIMYYIREFFLVSLRRPGTRKSLRKIAKFTRKSRFPK